MKGFIVENMATDDDACIDQQAILFRALLFEGNTIWHTFEATTTTHSNDPRMGKT